MSHRTPLALGAMLALCAGSVYGSVPVLTRFAFRNGVPAIETIAFRTFCVALVLVLFAAWRSDDLRVPQPLWGAFAGQVVATFAVSTCYLLSVQFIPVGLAVIIFFTFPVIISLLAPLVEGEGTHVMKLACSVLAFVGLVVAVGPSFGDVSAKGLLLAAGAAMGCALQFFTGRRLGAAMTPAAFGGLVHLAVWPMVMVVAAWLTTGPYEILPGGSAKWLGLIAGIGVAVAYLAGYSLHMTTLRVSQPSAVAPYFNIEPVVSTLLAILLLGEQLSPVQYVGAALVLLAIVLTPLVGERRLKT